MQIGSLSNYKVVLYYSLAYPGRSSLETSRLVNQEYVPTPPSKATKAEDPNEQRTTKKMDSVITKTDYMIKMMAEELSNVTPFSKELRETWTSKDSSWFERMDMTEFNSGQYIDLYI